MKGAPSISRAETVGNQKVGDQSPKARSHPSRKARSRIYIYIYIRADAPAADPFFFLPKRDSCTAGSGASGGEVGDFLAGTRRSNLVSVHGAPGCEVRV